MILKKYITDTTRLQICEEMHVDRPVENSKLGPSTMASTGQASWQYPQYMHFVMSMSYLKYFMNTWTLIFIHNDDLVVRRDPSSRSSDSIVIAYIRRKNKINNNENYFLLGLDMRPRKVCMRCISLRRWGIDEACVRLGIED